MRNNNISFYEPKNLFLSFNGPFCPISHNEILKSFAGARRFTVGLFSFHKSSLGQSHTRRCDLSENRHEGEVLRVSVAVDETFSGDSHTNRLPGSVTVGSVSQGVFIFL